MSPSQTVRILMSGSSGLIGSALVPALQSSGHTIFKLVRRQDTSAVDEIVWNPQRGLVEQSQLEGFDAVIHLAGENIAAGRWSDTRKKNIRESRVSGTALLSAALAQCRRPPRTFISASAIGFYGDRGAEVCTEASLPGRGFLSSVVQEWEAATKPARDAGIRVVTPRFGMVLSAQGGALAKMLPIFRLGLGGRLGNGRQYISWIEIGDLVRLLIEALSETSIEGPLNCVSPQPVTNAEFTRKLARALKRPAMFPVPAAALRLLLGGLADEVLLASTLAASIRINSKFVFEYPELEAAFEHLLHRHASGAAS